MRTTGLILCVMLISTATAAWASPKEDDQMEMKRRDWQPVEDCNTRVGNSPEGLFIAQRFWRDTDTSPAKLQDETKLTGEEQRMVLQYLLLKRKCREMTIQVVSKWEPWAVSVFTASASRYEEAYMRVAMGQTTVGECNRTFFQEQQQFYSEYEAATARAREQYAAAETRREAEEEAAEAQKKAAKDAARQESLQRVSRGLKELGEALGGQPTQTRTQTLTNCRTWGNNMTCIGPGGSTFCRTYGNNTTCTGPGGSTSCRISGNTMTCH